MKIGLILIAMALAGLHNSLSCSAITTGWSDPCLASDPITLPAGSYIQYRVVVDSSDYDPADVTCQVLGLMNYKKTDSCQWGWHAITDIKYSDEDVFLWGDQVSRPGIRCYSKRKYLNIIWSYYVGESNLTCEPKNSHQGKLSFDDQGVFGSRFD